MTDYEQEATNAVRLERLTEEIAFSFPHLTRDQVQVEAERQLAAETLSRQEAWQPTERRMVRPAWTNRRA